MATAVITGANRGIGLALARGLIARGDTVVATVRDPSAAGDLAALAEASGRVTILRADVTRPEDLAALTEGGPVDLLVCNAGQYRGRGGIDSDDNTPEAWGQVLMANVAGPFFTVRAVLPRLRQTQGARVAVISSIMGSSARAPGGSYLYRASKAAATNLARNLAADLAPHGIAVGAWHPGWVRTDMGGDAADIGVAESAEGLLRRFDALDLATTGVFEGHDGTPIPF